MPAPRSIFLRSLSIPAIPLWAAALHLLLAFIFYCRGLHFELDAKRAGWDFFWQAIPVDDLLNRPWSSFWHLHAQPPGFSLWGLIWLRVFGESWFPGSTEVGYALLGALTVLLTGRLAIALGAGEFIAALASFGMAINPSLLLYESYPLYEMINISLILGSATLLWEIVSREATARPGIEWRLWLFGLLLNLLTLTRSLFHWFFLWIALAFAWTAIRRMRPAWRFFFLVIVIAPTGFWYAKNRVQYGFFGASSWFGLGLYKCVAAGFSYEELVKLRDEGTIQVYVEERSSYQHYPSQYREFGFTKTSGIPLLNRDDFHNINVPDISKGYLEASKRLIRLYPLRYLKSLCISYCWFCVPPSRFVHLIAKGDIYMPRYDAIFSRWLYGQGITDEIALLWYWDLGSMFFFYFPVIMLWAARWTWRRVKEKEDRLARPRAILMGYMIYICLWIAAVGCMFEKGENMRFRFATEPFTLIMTLMLLAAAWRALPARVRAALTPEPRLFR